MSNLPDRFAGRPGNSRQLARAAQAREKTELAVYEHHLQARFLSEVERIDAEALADVVKTAINEELDTLDYGLGLAAGSTARAELVSRLVSLQSKLDGARIARRFGG
ncbi:MAG TPA: hypothetical protein VF245_02475 [Solirubrobacterales bacterium]